MRRAPELRPATRADAGFLARGIDEAADGLFAAMLGRTGLRILATVVSQPEHQLSFEHAVVAAQGGDPVGFCLGWPARTPKADGALARAAGLHLPRLLAVALLGRPVLTAMGEHAAGDWYMQALAVVPRARGTGVGSGLVTDALERAGAAGCATFTTDVEAGNVRARALYERLGLRVVGTSRPAPLLAGARVYRMHLTLPGVSGPGGA